MKVLYWAGVFLVIPFAVFAGPLTLDGVAAYVDDAVITVGDVMDAIQPAYRQLRQLHEGAELESRVREAYTNALAGLIAEKLILKAYEKEKPGKAEFLDRYVERKIDAIVHDRFQGNRAALLETLSAERLTLEEWRNQLRARIIVSYMKSKEIENRIVIPPKQVRDRYEAQAAAHQRPAEIKLRMIVIPGGKTPQETDAPRALAATTRRQLLAGKDFAETARKLSGDAKAESGGDWGWLDPSALRKELAEAAAGVRPGGISEVIEAEGDFYILKVEGRHEAGPIPFEEAREEIERDLQQGELKRLQDAWIERLKKNSRVTLVETEF